MWHVKHERQCFKRISKYWEESLKYDAWWSILDAIWGVWIANETLSLVFMYIFSIDTKFKELTEK